jgi:outer membrane receptor protein involved in Fe transport
MGKVNHIAAGLLAGASVLALASAANAQAQQAAQQVEEVVVTGSRVIANGNDMPTPVTIVAPQDLTAATPSTVMEAIQQLPVFSGGTGPNTNPGNSSRTNNSHRLNLRDIGVTRTLVLFDGRRVASSDYQSNVDADLIPQMLLQRVDVVTGGASAVYGSDAVAGVVNFITDHKFNGIKTNFNAGVSEYGDGRSQRAGIAGGMDVLDGKGHIEGSFEWYNNDGISGPAKLRRAWAAQVISMQGAGSAANPYHLVYNTRLSSTSFLGYITSGTNSAANPLRDEVFYLNGVLRPFQHGAVTGGSGVESGGDGAYYYQASLEASAKSAQLFSRFDYDVSDDMHFFVEGGYTKINNENNHQTNEFRNISLYANNAFLAPAYQAQLAAAKITVFNFSKMMMQMTPLQPDSWTTSAIVTAGFNGTFQGYKWDLSYSRNDNQEFARNNANIDQRKAFAALDAVVNPANGQIVCNVTLTNPSAFPGCVPLNLFGPTSESQDAINYISAVTSYRARTHFDDIGGSISGSPIDDWAGPVEVALSGEWRNTAIILDSNAQPSSLVNCAEVRLACQSASAPFTPKPAPLLFISNTVSTTPKASQSVWEGALETEIPLLKDLPFAQDVNMSAAVRYTDYNTSGTVTTWKVGGTWAVDDDLTLRVTRSLDIRAPNLTELFAATAVNPAGVTDLHTNNTVGQAPFVTLSNPNLVPEKANTLTAGVVYKPSWLPDFSVSVDYYHIKIGNAITTIQGQSTQIQGICEASGGTSPYCALIKRPLPFSDHTINNFVSEYDSVPQNAQSVKTEGTDVEMNYQTDLGPGHLAARLLGSYQPMLDTIQFAGATVQNAAGSPVLPSVKLSLFLKYSVQDWQFDVNETWHDSLWWNADRTLIYALPRIPDAFYTNATVTYKWDPAEVYLTVQNLFNRQPSPYGNVGGSSGVPGLFGGFLPGVEDAIGRYYTVGVRLKF